MDASDNSGYVPRTGHGTEWDIRDASSGGRNDYIAPIHRCSATECDCWDCISLSLKALSGVSHPRTLSGWLFISSLISFSSLYVRPFGSVFRGR